MFKKISKYIEKLSIKEISAEIKDSKLHFKMENLSLNAKGTPDVVIKKLVISEVKEKSKNAGAPHVVPLLPFAFEGIDILISQQFITSLLNIGLSGLKFIDYLKFKIEDSKLILKGAVKKYILFPFYIQVEMHHVKNFLCVEFKSLWLMDILPFPIFTIRKVFDYLEKKINLPFIAFEGSRVFVDLEKIEFFKKKKMVLKKLRAADGFINFVMDIEI